ncbi:hypothetical protein D16iCDA_03955 [Pseudomonas seleniipraecipitans]|jgi:hypothetical protein|uniref:Uncharacterized protein n=1 Tax=Phytopseudomonas seleniipraecipitans TaxID=640205 RepID=A0A1G7N6H5_9GAMM|nr:hypothetical protein [Pseudomonas seleniipraecipitans]NQD79136.1 hypothetical protein [Pseudomonas sp. CrR14]UUD64855.1 hypothetical protein D16iCDA_03955 [Pseudomonas seleniipraecipitans]SDF68920.1 hypothetical protein SAMN05216381_2135 [Pseudomonas seleniipraecipitans]
MIDCRHGVGCVLLSLMLAGCASTSCDEPLSGDSCRDRQLLHQNDMLQAKLLVASGDMETHELASALLRRAESEDELGEVAFYQAILMIREGPQTDEVLSKLEDAAQQHQPYAVALLYKIWSEPFLVDEADPIRAEQYRADYAELDVAKSGYPSFEKALELVNGLVRTP